MASFVNNNIHASVKKIKDTLVQSVVTGDLCSMVSPSAYDTAWLAMTSDPKQTSGKPMFMSCLEWVLNNQMPEGFWGERDCHGNATIDSLPATLACMASLRTWNTGHDHIERGKRFIEANSSRLLELKGNRVNFPRWFAIVFPGMVELAHQKGLEFKFLNQIKEVAHVFCQRQEILKTKEQLVEGIQCSPLLLYFEVLPSVYKIEHKAIHELLSTDGSLFHSPSATAAAFMATGDLQALSYLRQVEQRCINGVPAMYPIDEGSLKLSMINQLQRLGLSEYFTDEINTMLEHIYTQYNAQTQLRCASLPARIFQNSLAFQVLRLQGYAVSARSFFGFLSDNVLKHIEENYEEFASALYYLYRATNVMFKYETELERLRSFLRGLLEKCCLDRSMDDNLMMWPNLQEAIKRELSAPWMARMDHLEHRNWITANKKGPLWLGKASYYRILSCFDDTNLLQLAKENYEHRQAVYRHELHELQRWCKVWGLMDLGFAREKSTYCYFAMASCVSLPLDSDVRLMAAKNGVLITIIDDFFDLEGSLEELHRFAKAVHKWDERDLRGHSRILFDALDNFVSEIAEKYFDQHAIDISNNLRLLWCETIASWLMEATWSRTGHTPSMTSYLETGMISVAAHMIVLQASCLMSPSLSPQDISPSKYQIITELLMTSCRLLNDIQSYEREEKDGKLNSILLYVKENSRASIEEAIARAQNVLEGAKMKLLEHALMEGTDNLPRPCKMLHLIILKVFQMFYDSTNRYDSKDSLLSDINDAIFHPLEDHASFPLRMP